jgi:hypothetical protein
MPSANIAELWLKKAAMNFVIAIATFPTIAAKTASRDSDSIFALVFNLVTATEQQSLYLIKKGARFFNRKYCHKLRHGGWVLS